jgi:DNA topoisomerase-1
VVKAIESARKVGLRYVSDTAPGLRRVRTATGFRYCDPTGRPVRDEETLARIRKLAIPPAWTRVWICREPQGHLQVTGRDADGRKQYRYHALWRQVRDETKYGNLIEFARALPAIRSRVQSDLGLPDMPRDKVLATIVRLLETTLIRVGNEEYARCNGSYGLTTLRNKHVRIDGPRLEFHFRGKSGIEHVVALSDRRLAAIVRRSRDLPGYELFRYVDGDGNARPIASDDVNAYIRAISGRDFTAKDFRTWAGTLHAAIALRTALRGDPHVPPAPGHAKTTLATAIDAVAARLGNTRTICRKCYLHPAVIDAYLDGTLRRLMRTRAGAGAAALDPDESAVLALLQRRSGKRRITYRTLPVRTRAASGVRRPRPSADATASTP